MSITGLKIRVFCRAGSTRHKWVIKVFVLLENIPPTMTSRLQADEGENDMTGSPPGNISPRCGRYIKKKEKCQSGFLFRYIKNRPAFHSCRELLFQSGTGVIFFGYLYFRVGIGVFFDLSWCCPTCSVCPRTCGRRDGAWSDAESGWDRSRFACVPDARHGHPDVSAPGRIPGGEAA